jgi:alkanesulfonate monooxygenase SsuD/methylene tetrahydromethanopterin reductase-like flavin-dependent oxidoreductase (luciferase family)
MFHLMPYRELPQDVTERTRSTWVTPPRDLFDPARGHVIYNQSLDELEYAAALGFDGICVNEHHQNAYGMMPSPNLMAAALARRTRDAAIVVLGNSIALYNPPVRVAEEFAMLDCVTGGRLIAGFPVGTSMDTNFAYGQNPALLRERYYEAADLILRAWSEREPFAFNGTFTQLRYVNIWPYPLQQPHPPIWVPGGGSVETWDWTIEHDYLYAFLSYGGYKRAQKTIEGYWGAVERHNVAPNPYRTAFLQLVVTGASESEIEERYGPHIEFFFNKMLHAWPGFSDAPGYRTIETIRAGLLGQTGSFGDRAPATTFRDFVDNGNVIVGTPSQVAEQLEHASRSLRTGHLLLLNQIGSMPHDLALENIRLTAEQVLPKIKHLWDDEWQDEWWIHPLAAPTVPAGFGEGVPA